MSKKPIIIVAIVIGLFVSGYYVMMFTSGKVNSMAEIEMFTIVGELKNYARTNGTLPENISEFMNKNNLLTKIKFGPFSTEIKIYIYDDETCDIEYLQVPFGPLAGINMEREELYFLE